jgi:phosphoribosylanthranilate isomerase
VAAVTTLVKVCGIRSIAEGRAALEAGAAWLGFIFWTPGKRFVAPDEAARIIAALRQHARDWSAVGVFVDPQPLDVAHASDLCGLDYVQLSGNEPAALVAAMPRPTVKAIHVRAGLEAAAVETITSNALGAQLYLLDTHAQSLPGGTGRSFDWDALREVGPRCLVAGGLRADNVQAALTTLRPLGVDVSSGVEFPSGGKDPRQIRAFLDAVRSFDSKVDARAPSGGAVS